MKSDQNRGGAATEEARAQMTSLKIVLAEQVARGDLWEPISDQPGWVHCYACGHDCRIPPGRDGICRVRFNREGTLYVPDGYVGALQCDPVEKKPFFHALPGSLALSFGMLGCDYHCAYCFAGDTRVITDHGVVPIAALWEEAAPELDAETAPLRGWKALAHDGRFSTIRHVFRHAYRGAIIKITPYNLPSFRCTPDHRVLVTTDPDIAPSWKAARSLATGHYLVAPDPADSSTGGELLDRARWVGQGRRVHQLDDSAQPTVALLEESASTHFLVPIRRVAEEDFEGFVYNLEVDEPHTYTASSCAVHNCQNWITSQALRDPASVAPPMATSPADLVGLARQHGAPILASTYNEPLITSEWAVKIFRKAKQAGLVCAYISNGNATPRVLDYIRPWVDLYKVDLKGFDEKRYHQLGGVLKTVLDTIVNLKERGFWVEVVTLIVPGFNDSDEELNGIARFIAGVDRNIPWHVTAFHQDYKMTDRPDTSVDVLLRAAEFGRTAGLNFVYAGNRPGHVSDLENTRCPQCRALLIERVGYTVLANRILDSRCPECRTEIPGVWTRPLAPLAAR